MNKQLEQLLDISFDKVSTRLINILTSEKPEGPENPLKPFKQMQESNISKVNDSGKMYKNRVQKGYEIILNELKKYH